LGGASRKKGKGFFLGREKGVAEHPWVMVNDSEWSVQKKGKGKNFHLKKNSAKKMLKGRAAGKGRGEKESLFRLSAKEGHPRVAVSGGNWGIRLVHLLKGKWDDLRAAQRKKREQPAFP